MANSGAFVHHCRHRSLFSVQAILFAAVLLLLIPGRNSDDSHIARPPKKTLRQKVVKFFGLDRFFRPLPELKFRPSGCKGKLECALLAAQ
eukprot:205971-Rhodomonas_salina.1